jgi:hypothetical protein
MAADSLNQVEVGTVQDGVLLNAQITVQMATVGKLSTPL